MFDASLFWEDCTVTLKSAMCEITIIIQPIKLSYVNMLDFHENVYFDFDVNWT